MEFVPYLTAALAVVFTAQLFAHLRRRPGARHLLWWMIGVAVFGLAVLAEALVHHLGWSPWLFRVWYVGGALLGGALLAQGTVYLLLRRRTADRLAIVLTVYALVAAALVFLTPLAPDPAHPDALTGRVMVWSWVRALTPALNLYAVVFLIGGALVSAIRYWRRRDDTGRFALGSALIAVGAILPAFRGVVARIGVADTVYLTEFVGLGLIYAGYRLTTSRTRAATAP